MKIIKIRSQKSDISHAKDDARKIDKKCLQL